eukprot:UC1_evm7s1936
MTSQATKAAAKAVLDGCTLTYFGMTGRGEGPRLALVLAGVDFTDERIQGSEWPALKASTPWGSMPVLTLKDGTRIAQVRAILRYLGRVTGLHPTDDLLAARCDEIMDVAEDINIAVNNTGRGLGAEEKNAARLAAVTDDGNVAQLLQRLDSYIAAHGSNLTGHSVGNSLTTADLAIVASLTPLTLGFFDGVPKDVLEKYSNIMAVRRAVAKEWAVRGWYARHGEGNAPDFEANYRNP